MEEKKRKKLTIGQKIRRAREKAGLTQTQLAEAVGYKEYKSIQLIEQDVTQVKLPRLKKIAKALNKPSEYFL